MDEAAKRSDRPPEAAGLPQAVAEALSRGVSVLTPNQRAAHALRQAYAAAMQAGSAPRWTPPEIVSLDSWTAQLWHRMTLAGTAGRLLLSRTQEHTVWRGFLAADPEVSSLRSLDSLAAMAAQAWHMLCLWNGRARLADLGAGTDSKAFQRWAHSFEQTNQRFGFLSAAQLPAALASAVQAGDLPIPDAGLLLVDFDTLPPALSQLFESIERAGYGVARLQTSLPVTSAHATEAPDERAEVQAAAHWTRRILERNPVARIAIVVPNLADRRPQIARVFGEILAPELEQITAPQAAGPFEFSLGQPLAETPMVAAALDLLRWALEPLPLPNLGDLLLSPFFGASTTRADQLAAAEFDAEELREAPLLRPELSLEATARLIESSPRATPLASLLHRLRAMRHAARAERLLAPAHQQPHAEWSDAFRRLLDAAGWTRTAAASSLAFQTHRRFESALDELATLDFDGTHTTVSQALAALTRITRQAIFAPESRNAPVQILGPLEVGGVPFDALWFLGAGDLTWPQTPPSSPLLPWQLQRSLGLPGTDPARDHATALALTRRISASAREVVFSFAAQAEEGEQRPSPVLAALDLEPLPHLPAESPAPALPLEDFADDTPIPGLPDRVTPGGAQVLASQAACAFRAFAEHRLFSTAPGLRPLGLDALERGSIVHRVMEHFWNLVPDQSELRALPLTERHAMLDECIARALAKPQRSAETSWDTAYLTTQRLRLRDLLRPWLDNELARPPFAVRKNEEPREVALGPLRLSLRVDRIDETEAGRVILDYKTGLAAPSQWLTDRPDAPQLPLYAVVSEEPVAGVAFALLRAGDELGLKGFADSEDVFGKPTRMELPLEDQVREWREVLTALANDFYNGEAAVAPKSYPQTCTYCAQRILCRLNPASLGQTEEALEESPDA
jgi:probable DNA repair protein